MNKSGIGEAGGSFGIPQDVLDAVEGSKKKAKGKRAKTKKVAEPEETFFDSESIPEEDVKEEKESPEKDKDPEVSDQEEIEALQKELQIEISEDDIWKVFMGGQLEKKGITVIPGKLEVSFTTLSLDQTQYIDSSMAKALELKFLEAGYRNLQTQHLLSAGIVSLGKPGKLKPFGENDAERFNMLGKMSTLLVEKLAHRWNQYTWLVNKIVNKEMDSGKS